jgi:hypothetical protein
MKTNSFEEYQLHRKKRTLIRQGIVVGALAIPLLTGVFFNMRALILKSGILFNSVTKETSAASDSAAEDLAETTVLAATTPAETQTEEETTSSIYANDIQIVWGETMTMEDLMMEPTDEPELTALVSWPDGYNYYENGQWSFACPNSFFQTFQMHFGGLYKNITITAADGTILYTKREDDFTAYQVDQGKAFLEKIQDQVTDYTILECESDADRWTHVVLKGVDAEDPNLVVWYFYTRYAEQTVNYRLKITYPAPATEEEEHIREYFVEMVSRSVPFNESDKDLCTYEEYLEGQ